MSDTWYRGRPKSETEFDELLYPARFKDNPGVHPRTFFSLERVFGPHISRVFLVSPLEWQTLMLWLPDVLQQGVSPNVGYGARLLREGLALAEDEDALAQAYRTRDVHREYWESTGMW